MSSPPPPIPVRYRAVSRMAVLSTVCGVASAALVFRIALLLAFPAAALLLGWLGLRQIDRMPEEYTGERLAKTGLILGAVFGLLGGGWLWFGGSEVPPGYQVLDYADLQPDPNVRDQIVPPGALKLSDDKKNVYVKGYILPGRRQVEVTNFFICRTSDMCRFQSSEKKSSDLIRIELKGDLKIDYTMQQIGIGGLFHAETDFVHGTSKTPQTPYTIEGNYIYR